MTSGVAGGGGETESSAPKASVTKPASPTEDSKENIPGTTGDKEVCMFISYMI